MHTIESSVLIPMGIGLISLLIMLTFYLHDQTVLEAESSSMLLHWQMCQGDWDEEAVIGASDQWSERMLITEAKVERLLAGKTLYSIQVEEQYRLFQGALSLLEQLFPKEETTPLRVIAKVNPCWLKRIWKVVAEE